jgi:hypothetical protein
VREQPRVRAAPQAQEARETQQEPEVPAAAAAGHPPTREVTQALPARLALTVRLELRASREPPAGQVLGP